MSDFQNGIKDLFDDLLSQNSYGIEWDVALYNTEKVKYTKNENDSDGLTVSKKRVVPTLINVAGNYLNIPNVTVLELTGSLEFDLFIGNYNSVPLHKQDEFLSVDYNNVQSAIIELQSKLIGKKLPIGTRQLVFGGEESTVNATSTTSKVPKYIYLKFKKYNYDEENILDFTSFCNLSTIGTSIVFSDDTVNTITLPYNINEEIELTIYYDGTDWTMTNGTTEISMAGNTGIEAFDFTIGDTTGFFGEIERLVLHDVTFDSVDEILTPLFEMKDFEDRYEIDNLGTIEFDTTNEINNCIISGDDGNIVFEVSPIVPVSDIRPLEGGYDYQIFAMDLEMTLSKDVLFGNDYEYFLTIDGEEKQIYPFDRHHSYATNSESESYINTAKGKDMPLEASDELVHTFFYQNDTNLNKLEKHVTGRIKEISKEYTLTIQCPFHREEYSVMINNGGTKPNIGNLVTITITYKERDERLDD